MKRLLKILAVLLGLLAIAFVLLRTPDTDAEAMRAKYGSEPSQFVTLENGQTVHLRDEGAKDAPALVLLHGSNADLHTWQPWVDALKDEYRVIRFDQIGHGLTGPSVTGTYEREDFVAGVEAVTDHLGLDRFVLAGSSMGGGITVGYALEHPERLNGIVLVGSAGAPVRREGDGRSLPMKLAATPVINQVMAHVTPRSMVESSFKKMVTNQAIMTPEVVDRYWELLRYPGNRQATITRFGMARSAFSEDQMADLNVPALLIWGAQDPLIPLSSGEWYDEHLPNSTLIAYPEIGHLPHEEEPGTIADLSKWLLNLTPQTDTAEDE